MSSNDFSLPERAALLALMGIGREVSNPELAELTGFTLTGKERTRLNERHLVTSRKVGRAYAHELTDQGWKWCTDELGAGQPPPRSGSAGGALYAVLAGLGEFLVRSDLHLADVFGRRSADGLTDGPEPEPSAGVEASPAPGAGSDDLAGRVRAAYRRLARGPRDWVRLAALRPLLADADPAELDTVLRRLNRDPRVNIVPQANQKTLTAADHDAAVRIGDEDNHLISIEE